MLSCRRLHHVLGHNPQRWLAAGLNFVIEAGSVPCAFRPAAKRFWANMYNIYARAENFSCPHSMRRCWPLAKQCVQLNCGCAYHWCFLQLQSRPNKFCSNQTWNSHLRRRTLKHGWLLAKCLACLACHVNDGGLDQDRLISSGDRDWMTAWHWIWWILVTRAKQLNLYKLIWRCVQSIDLRPFLF